VYEVLRSTCLSVCMFPVCLLAYLETTRPNFTKFSVRYPWPWFGPSLTTTQYIMYF